MNNHHIIVNNLEDANILHIFCGSFMKEYLFVKDELGLDHFINTTFLSSYFDNILKINNKKEFYDTFDEKPLDIFTYFDNKKSYD